MQRNLQTKSRKRYINTNVHFIREKQFLSLSFILCRRVNRHHVGSSDLEVWTSSRTVGRCRSSQYVQVSCRRDIHTCCLPCYPSQGLQRRRELRVLMCTILLASAQSIYNFSYPILHHPGTIHIYKHLQVKNHTI